MKMVKSLLLGSAAGLVAVTAGQAAELPVKARPVQYVKVCSLYGAGFYYMPGTDMCIKIGGWVRFESTYNSNGNLAWGPFNGNVNQLNTNNLTARARGYITADAREQTAYGVARGYIAVGISQNEVVDSTGGSSAPGITGALPPFSSNRAFVQWAGFTAGLATSFYDFYPAAAQNYRAGYLPQEDTGDGGWDVLGYTAQLGGGVSATLSAEARRTSQIIDNLAGAIGGVGGIGSLGSFSSEPYGYGGWNMPDIVGNIRADQAWGSAQLMGVVHQVNANYYGATEATGHPSTAYGYVVGAGLKLNAPMISPGDFIIGEANYAVGATNYLANGERSNFANAQGATGGYGIQADCVTGTAVNSASANATGCQLTTGWEAIASYEHYWTPQWHESFTGAYMNLSYDPVANANLCVLEGQGTAGTSGSTAVGAAGCNNNWSYWGAGTRLQWDVTKSFYVGVEALYSQLISASSSTGFVPAGIFAGTSGSLCATAGNCTAQNEGNWAFTVRMHKDFLP